MEDVYVVMSHLDDSEILAIADIEDIAINLAEGFLPEIGGTYWERIWSPSEKDFVAGWGIRPHVYLSVTKRKVSSDPIKTITVYCCRLDLDDLEIHESYYEPDDEYFTSSYENVEYSTMNNYIWGESTKSMDEARALVAEKAEEISDRFHMAYMRLLSQPGGAT